MLREHFKCDEPSGNLVGLVSGTILSPTGAPTYGAAGQFGNAVLANSSNQFVGSSPVLNLGDGTTDWTVVAWIRRAAGNGGILNKIGGDSDLAVDFSGFQGIRFSYGSAIIGLGSIAVGAWASISFKYVAADLVTYGRLNNGVAVLAVRVLPGPFGSDNLNLGTGGSLWGFDEIGLYDHALSDAELTALMTTVPDRIAGARFRAGQGYNDGWRAGQRLGAGGV